MTIKIDVYVQPGAKQTEIAGQHDGRVKIRLKTPPVDGKANAELVRFIAVLLALRKQDISIVSGLKSRLKTLSVPKTNDVYGRLKNLDLVP